MSLYKTIASSLLGNYMQLQATVSEKFIVESEKIYKGNKHDQRS